MVSRRWLVAIGGAALTAAAGACSGLSGLAGGVANDGGSLDATNNGDSIAPDTSVTDTNIADAQSDDTGIPSDAPVCFGPAGWTVCLSILPTRTFVAPATIDTETSSECLTSIPTSWSAAGQPDACIIVAKTITITSGVTVSGGLPLVLVATDSINVAAHVEVASHRAGVVGPGANPTACPAYTTAPQPSNVAGFAGGGAGASFQSIGGAGGPGNGNTNNRGLPTPAQASVPATLLGGCRGQAGGLGISAGGLGGDGGGAVYLVAGNAITFAASGSINASGAGATGGSHYSGGGGGGSGGIIALYAASMIATPGAVVVANGGGGGSGTDGTATGADGNDPTPTTPAVAARGGTIGGNGNGGDGFAGSIQATAGFGASGVGGGGGGGGAGHIVSNRPLTGATVSPSAATW